MHASRVQLRIGATLPATLEASEAFSLEFRRRAEDIANRADRFAAELLLREALTNAIVHGCRGDANCRVRCAARVRGRRLLIVVRDEGEGFAWRQAWGRQPGLSLPRGRGLEILRRYATHVRFNVRGNAVTMIKLLSANPFQEEPAS